MLYPKKGKKKIALFVFQRKQRGGTFAKKAPKQKPTTTSILHNGINE